jgi:hypothetical protein
MLDGNESRLSEKTRGGTDYAIVEKLRITVDKTDRG